MSCLSETTTPNREPLISTALPSHPWERIASDQFELKNSTYLLTVDYYSRFVEVQKLNSTTSSSVITHLKSIFARFGIPAEMVSDNGPQFSSQEMKEFSETYGFRHITTSPHYPLANGLAERMVKPSKVCLRILQIITRLSSATGQHPYPGVPSVLQNC